MLTRIMGKSSSISLNTNQSAGKFLNARLEFSDVTVVIILFYFNLHSIIFKRIFDKLLFK